MLLLIYVLAGLMKLILLPSRGEVSLRQLSFGASSRHLRHVGEFMRELMVNSGTNPFPCIIFHSHPLSQQVNRIPKAKSFLSEALK